MEPDQERIAHIMQVTGTTEDEARILAHLDAARDGFFDLSGYKNPGESAAIWYHFDALTRIIASRVAERDHPEGWLFSRDLDDDEDEGVAPQA
jgi:hypothetical protein